MRDTRRAQEVRQAIGWVVEGVCPLCQVALRIHDGTGCCPCCGDSYQAGENRLEISQCPQHGRSCDHWLAVLARNPLMARVVSIE